MGAKNISENPEILGLGPLELRGTERRHPRAGRLDLLLQDTENLTRYEIELQLGRTDESHIVRTIEYWDIERRRYPQYDHCAVIIAEDITSRFLNVIALFNGSVPIIAIQMQALRVGDAMTLAFSTILNEFSRGVVDEDEEAQAAPTDRADWEQRASKQSLGIVDNLLMLARTFEPGLDLRFKKNFIGLGRNGQPFNFVWFVPRKSSVTLALSLPRESTVDKKIEEAGLSLLAYNNHFGRYRISLSQVDVMEKKAPIAELIGMAYRNRVE